MKTTKSSNSVTGGLDQKGTDSDEDDTMTAPVREPLSYQDIMHRLVARFIHQTKKEMKMDGVNEDDLLEIKQDISSLRLVVDRVDV